MTEKPILFSGPMVRAIQSGQKTMTRRVVKWKPRQDGLNLQATSLQIGDYFTGAPQHGKVLRSRDGGRWNDKTFPVHCPYGNIGDHLWIRERMRVLEIITSFDNHPDETKIRVRYEADGAESDWLDYPERLKGKPVVGKCLSYGGYREASRITLEITDVRVERLQSISGADVLSEGINLSPLWEKEGVSYEEANAVWPTSSPKSESESLDQSYDAHLRACFKRLWDKLNAKRGYGWNMNPFVWVIEFKRL